MLSAHKQSDKTDDWEEDQSWQQSPGDGNISRKRRDSLDREHSPHRSLPARPVGNRVQLSSDFCFRQLRNSNWLDAAGRSGAAVFNGHPHNQRTLRNSTKTTTWKCVAFQVRDSSVCRGYCSFSMVGCRRRNSDRRKHFALP